jgi:hypothetical protein
LIAGRIFQFQGNEMATDVTTIVIPLRNGTPLGRLNYDEALGALNKINSLGWTIGGTGTTLNPLVDTGTVLIPTDYIIGEFNSPWSRNLVQQIRDSYPPAARLNLVEWTAVIVAINSLAGSIVVPASGDAAQ